MKKYLLPGFLLIYVIALLTSLLITIKPGAGIFYLKTTLKPGGFQYESGYAYRYEVQFLPALFPLEKALIFENGQQLAREVDRKVINTGNGLFNTERSPHDGQYIYISPIGNTDPTSDGKTYRLYSACSLLTRTMGIVYLSILLFGIVRFIIFAYHQKKRLISFSSLFEITNDYIDHVRSSAGKIFERSQAHWRARLAAGIRLLAVTAASAYALTLMEWLFQVTKSSFMDGLSLDRKFGVFLISGLALAVAGLAINLAILAVGILLRYIRLAWLATCSSVVVPAGLLTALVVLWLDSFTYIVFHFGILTSPGSVRIVYGIVIALIFLEFYRRLLTWSFSSHAVNPVKPFEKVLGFTVIGLIGISAIFALIPAKENAVNPDLGIHISTEGQDYPNIILIGTDGLSADNMSVYGYDRLTTPNIDALAEDSLVAENAFTNSGKTYGSIISIFTSKMPTRTRQVFPPDMLQGIDSYQHFPGILKSMGYSTAQVGVSEFIDATAANLQDGFDVVNQRIVDNDVFVRTVRKLGYDLPAYFFFTIEERLGNRLMHAFYIDTIKDPFSVVTEAASWEDDLRRMDDLSVFLANSREPLFVHVHLMGTHGETFRPNNQTFSSGEIQDKEWMTDFYDDAILDYDAYIGRLVNELKESGQYDHTIIVLYSDHAMDFRTDERIPLIIHFPAGHHKGRLGVNVQNLDIAPTLLDFLGVPIPDWMEGRSILRLDPQQQDPIFSVTVDYNLDRLPPVEDVQNSDQLRTTNFRFPSMQVIICQRWYNLELTSHIWTSGDVTRYANPCEESSLPDYEQVEQMLIQFFISQGYDPAVVMPGS